jgi:hypothetical protein
MGRGIPQPSGLAPRGRGQPSGNVAAIAPVP